MNNRRRHSGIALIVTLLVIVILTIAVTAFMQSMSLERRTSQAYLNILRADEAVEAGLQKVTNVFAADTTNDYFTIVKIENTPAGGTVPISYYFIGKGSDAGSTPGKTPAPTNYTPLFSYLASPSTSPTPTPAPVAGASNNKPTLPTFADPVNGRPVVSSELTPVNTSWETIDTGDANFPKIRYCYWVEDLSGRVDASVAGNKLEVVGGTDTLQNNQNNDKHLRDGTFHADQLGVFTIFDKTSKTDPGGTSAGILYDYRSLFLSIPSLRQALGTNYTTYKTEVDGSITANLDGDQEQQVIPHGLGFVNAGQPKGDVNGVIADATLTNDQKVGKIADAISQNLPKFDARKGANYGRFKDASAAAAPGLHDYAKTIAASIIDYADADNKATVGTDYRGVDSYPFISEWAHKYVYIGVSSSSGSYTTEVTVTPYIEIWNLSDKSISGRFKFVETNTDTFANGVNAANFTQTNYVTNPSDIQKEYTIDSATPLLPNEYRVLQLATLDYKFPAGGTSPVFPTGIPINVQTLYTSKYGFYWEGSLVDEPFGMQESVSRTLTQNAPRWTAYIPGFRYLYSPGNAAVFWNAYGDPRGTFYIKKNVAVNTFNSTTTGSNRQTWWGRNSWNNSGQAFAEREMNPSKWLDGDHGNSALGGAVSQTGDPLNPPNGKPPTLRQEAVSTISNAGRYLSITEIGNIYDPAQWNAKGPTESSGTVPNYAPIATDIPANAGNASGSGAEGWGGGFTLRIGRAEFTRFTQSDVEPAWKLLDLLAAGSVRNTLGLININTASKDTLRTLIAGLVFTGDPGVRTGNAPTGNATQTPPTYPYSSAWPVVSQADTIAQAIIDGRPYLSPSQLSNLKIAGTNNAVFGDKARWISTDPDRPTEWDDAGAEEMFKSVYELSTVRSRNFRVFVTGQAINRLGKPVATSSRAFQIVTVPTRDPSTKSITKLQLKIKNETSL